jgi:outer membrane lipoprotein-sorting protein
MTLKRGYNRPMNYLMALLVFGLLALPATAAQGTRGGTQSELEDILNRMAAHDAWQDQQLREYQLHRKFYAANPRFKQESTIEVNTVFRQPSTFESEVIKTEGSELIRQRVFDKILEAEKEANTKKTRQEVAITPENYDFSLLGKQDCGGRPCYNLRIRPKQKNKYSIVGQIWVDAEDGALVRVQGTPAKRPSFWTTNTEIERRYKRVDGVWLCDGMESTSNILVAGRSTLKIEYNYLSIETRVIN